MTSRFVASPTKTALNLWIGGLRRSAPRAGAVATALVWLGIGPAVAEEVGGSTAAPSPAAAAPTLLPSLSGPLKANADPGKIDIGVFGPVYLGGVVTGLGLTQGHALTGDRRDRIDLSNGQVLIQKPDGEFQFFAQGGVYKQTALGLRDFNTLDYTRQLFGPAPVAFAKYAPTEAFSIQAGKLYTLIGPEGAFTFQNTNIERGLLFNQTNAVTRGVQANYASGPVTVSGSLNDGFYSDRYNWATGLISYKIDAEQTILFNAGANLGRTPYSSFAAPLLQNNSRIYDLVYTYTSGPWLLQPYLQYSNVPRDPGIGIPQGSSSYGAAVIGSYALTPEFSLAGRLEYIAQTGTRFNGTESLAFGPGSSAVSVTVTPTYQKGVFFARGEYSYVKAFDATPGLAFGRAGDRTSQSRVLLETGILF